MSTPTPTPTPKSNTHGFFDLVIQKTNELLEKEKQLRVKYNEELNNQKDQLAIINNKIGDLHTTFSQQKDILYNDFKKSIKALKQVTGLPLHPENTNNEIDSGVDLEKKGGEEEQH